MPANRFATCFTLLVWRRGIGTPSTCLRLRLEITARPASAATAVATVAAAAPLATVPAPVPTFSPTALEMPSPSEERLLGLEDAREALDVFFAELPSRLDAEREPALFLGLAVLGKESSWLPV